MLGIKYEGGNATTVTLRLSFIAQNKVLVLRGLPINCMSPDMIERFTILCATLTYRLHGVGNNDLYGVAWCVDEISPEGGGRLRREVVAEAGPRRYRPF